MATEGVGPGQERPRRRARGTEAEGGGAVRVRHGGPSDAFREERRPARGGLAGDQVQAWPSSCRSTRCAAVIACRSSSWANTQTGHKHKQADAPAGAGGDGLQLQQLVNQVQAWRSFTASSRTSTRCSAARPACCWPASRSRAAAAGPPGAASRRHGVWLPGAGLPFAPASRWTLIRSTAGAVLQLPTRWSQRRRAAAQVKYSNAPTICLRICNVKNCPECGATSPVYDTRDVHYAYKGRETTIPAVTGYHCMVCRGITMKEEATNRYSELIGKFQRQVNGKEVDPA